MTVSITDRFGLYRWSSDADPFTRTQMDTSHENIELYGAKMIRGAGVPSATGAEYKHTIYLNTTNNKLYYFDGTSTGTWRVLETEVVQNSLADAKGDTIVASADNTWAKLSVGTEGQILTVGSSSTVQWSAPAVQTPAGTVSATIAAAAPSGWLFLQGQTISSANTLYPSLWTVAPTEWKINASDMQLPDWRGYYMASYKAADAQFGTLGSTVAGARTIASANLPLHTHAIDHSHSAGTTVSSDISHSHTINHGHPASSGSNDTSHSHTMSHSHSGSSTSAGTHSHYINQGTASPGLGFLRRLTSYSSGYNLPAGLDGGGLAIDYTVVTDSEGSHSHPISVGGSSAPSTGTQSANHAHSVSVSNHSGSSGGMSANATTHTHSFTTPSFTGTSGNGEFANTAYVMPAAVVNWMIKAH